MPKPPSYPLVSSHPLHAVLAWRASGAVTVREFLADALSVKQRLPEGHWVLNLCEDRYHFAVVFAACQWAGKTSLQPSSQAADTLARIATDYPGAFQVSDAQPLSNALPHLRCADLLGAEPCATHPPVDKIPEVPADHVAAILFTSGSTGAPQPHPKSWGKLVHNGRAEACALGLLERPHAIVGTVPAQHSYGFESTFLLALHGGCTFWSGKPLFAQDVASALERVPEPRLLVTTPFHLSHMLASDVPWPPLGAVLSATAPLDAGVAAQAEARWAAPLHEIYGSTESSALASRRTVSGSAWQLLPAVELDQQEGITYAQAGHVEHRIALSDRIELLADGRFELLGRHADLVNVAGKRTSLAYLNHQLCALEGVEDGAFFLPDEASAHGITRLTAFVVAPTLDAASLRRALRQRIDPAFMPRPLLWVPALPRNHLGKLPRNALEQLFQQQTLRGRDGAY